MNEHIEITPGSGNVFLDLGFEPVEAQHLLVRADLMGKASDLIRARGWSQKQAAAALGVTQPRISDLVRGKIDRFSVDSLVEMLGRAGVSVKLDTGRSSSRARGPGTRTRTVEVRRR